MNLKVLFCGGSVYNLNLLNYDIPTGFSIFAGVSPVPYQGQGFLGILVVSIFGNLGGAKDSRVSLEVFMVTLVGPRTLGCPCD